jgi:hypothetical protein
MTTKINLSNGKTKDGCEEDKAIDIALNVKKMNQCHLFLFLV